MKLSLPSIYLVKIYKALFNFCRTKERALGGIAYTQAQKLLISQSTTNGFVKVNELADLKFIEARRKADFLFKRPFRVALSDSLNMEAQIEQKFGPAHSENFSPVRIQYGSVEMNRYDLRNSFFNFMVKSI